jgi:hypothetical protein
LLNSKAKETLLSRIHTNHLQNGRIHSSHHSPSSIGGRFAGFLLVMSLAVSACGNTSNQRASQLAVSPTIRAQETSIHPTSPATPDRSTTHSENPEKIDPPEKNTPASRAARATEITEGTPTPISPLILSNRPALFTSDLLFISEDRLMRWDHSTNYGVILAENVVEFSQGTRGNSIVLLRKKGVAANGVDLFDLDILDFETKQIHHLIEDIPDIMDIRLSPDGHWLAFRQPSQKANILTFRVSDPGELISIGSCLPRRATDCRELAWSPDSTEVIWIDKQGIWIADPLKPRPTNLNPGIVQILDPRGKSIEIAAQFSSPRWSPTGRFTLIKAHPEQSKVSWQVVLDTRTGKTVQVSDSYETDDQVPSLAWLEDGDLAVAYASDKDRKTAAALKLLAVVPTSTEMLVPGREYQFSPQDLPAILTSSDVPYEEDQPLNPDWLQPIQPGHLSLGIRFTGTTLQPILFDLNMENGALTQISQVSADAQKILWAPDGSGFLVCGLDGSLSFIQAHGGATINLQPFAGDRAHSFVWLPPAARK